MCALDRGLEGFPEILDGVDICSVDRDVFTDVVIDDTVLIAFTVKPTVGT